MRHRHLGAERLVLAACSSLPELEPRGPRSLRPLVAPSVTVTNRGGQAVYSGSQKSLSEAFPNFSVRRPMGGGGGSPAPLLLKPGQERTYRTFVILRGATLRASASISHARSGNHLVPAHAIIVTSPALHVRLGRSDPPRINLKRLAQRESAMLPKTDSHRRGSPWYIELARCGTSSTGSLAWSKVEIAAGYEFQIPAPCYGNPSAWRVAAGWVGQSLAFIRYR